MALSRTEAKWFLAEILNLPTSQVDSQPVTLSLLNAIIGRFQHIIPFQSVTSCAVPHDHRHLPTWDEIKEDIFTKRGGLCYQLNVFMKVLLESIGYDVYFASADIAKENDHVTVVVANLEGDGCQHLVEVGCGYPTLQAVPFDFCHESPEYISGFLRHKFVKRGESVIWYHEPRRAYRPINDSDLTEDGWYRYAEIRPSIPCGIEYFTSTMPRTYTNQKYSNFLQLPRAVILREGKLVAIKGKEYITEDNERKISRAEIGTLDRLLEQYREDFPQLSVAAIKDAVRHTDLTF